MVQTIDCSSVIWYQLAVGIAHHRQRAHLLGRGQADFPDQFAGPMEVVDTLQLQLPADPVRDHVGRVALAGTAPRRPYACIGACAAGNHSDTGDSTVACSTCLVSLLISPSRWRFIGNRIKFKG